MKAAEDLNQRGHLRHREQEDWAVGEARAVAREARGPRLVVAEVPWATELQIRLGDCSVLYL